MPEPLFDHGLIALRRRRATRRAKDGADFLLRHVAGDLMDRLDAVERSFPVALELHGHTGFLADRLLRSGKAGRVIRVETDAELAGDDAGASRETRIAPFDSVPAGPASLDLIVSPLSLHLTNDTPGVLVQACRALKPDGLFLAAMPGAGTLSELREAFLVAESEATGGAAPRVMPFASLRDAGTLLQRAGFALPVCDVDTLTVRYDDMFALIADLRAMGMQNPLRRTAPLSRGIVRRAAEIYGERFRDPDGRVRASFVIVSMSGWRPHESQQKPLAPGSATVSLADVLKAGRGGETS